MGAWGYGLFQSDHDLDVVDDLNAEAGINALEEAARTKAKSECKSSKEPDTRFIGPMLANGSFFKVFDTSGNEVKIDPEDKIRYSILADYCSDVGVVRDYLNEDERLIKLLDTYEEKMLKRPEKYDFLGAKYRFTILVACAMSLGCSIPDQHLTLLKTKFRHAGMMKDAVKQLDKALNQADGFKNDGNPYDFGSKGLMETMMTADPNSGPVVNVPLF